MIRYDNYSRVLELSRLPAPEPIIEPEKPLERVAKDKWNSWFIERYINDQWVKISKKFDTQKQANNVLTNREKFFKQIDFELNER